MDVLRPEEANNVVYDAWNLDGSTTENRVLAAATAENIAVPKGARVCHLLASADTTFTLNGDAAVAISDTTSQYQAISGIERRFSVSGVSNISLYSVDGGNIEANFWK